MTRPPRSSGIEKNISAQQAETQQDSRIPEADEHCGRSRRHQAPPSQRAQAAERLGALVRRRSRLSRSQDFQRVYRAGRSVANRYVVLYFFPQAADQVEKKPTPAVQVARVGFSVSKRLGSSVTRNKVKRLLRESFRSVEGFVKPGFDLVFIARTDLGPLVEERGLEGVRGKMVEVLRKGSLWSEEGDGTP